MQTWASILAREKRQPYYKTLVSTVESKIAAGQVVYPERPMWFRALDLTPYERVKVVILGQDPYHGPGQAHGLSFSVSRGCRIPPSLRNIFKALATDLNIDPPECGDLTAWAESGVLLLNTTLTVCAGQPQSHANLGWSILTDVLIAALNQHDQPLVFLLWGKAAQQKQSIIDDSRHLVLTAAHPSPLSAYRGFLDCRHFSESNAFLVENGIEPLDWLL